MKYLIVRGAPLSFLPNVSSQIYQGLLIEFPSPDEMSQFGHCLWHYNPERWKRKWRRDENLLPLHGFEYGESESLNVMIHLSQDSSLGEEDELGALRWLIIRFNYEKVSEFSVLRLLPFSSSRSNCQRRIFRQRNIPRGSLLLCEKFLRVS